MSQFLEQNPSELLENSVMITMLSDTQKCAGFIIQGLVGGYDGDYCRGTVLTIAKQPGANEPVAATEQHVSTDDEELYYTGVSREIDPLAAYGRLQHLLTGSQADIPSILIYAQAISETTACNIGKS